MKFSKLGLLSLALIVGGSAFGQTMILPHIPALKPGECHTKTTILSILPHKIGDAAVWRGVVRDQTNELTSYELYNSTKAWAIVRNPPKQSYGEQKSCIVSFGYYREDEVENSPLCMPDSSYDHILQEYAGLDLRWAGLSANQAYMYSLYTGTSVNANSGQWVIRGRDRSGLSDCQSILGDTSEKLGTF